MSTIASLDRIGVGIDTARYGHRVSFLRPDRKPAAKPLTVMENRAGYQALQDRLNQLHEQHPTANFHVRIDAAGQYAVNLELFLRSLRAPKKMKRMERRSHAHAMDESPVWRISHGQATCQRRTLATHRTALASTQASSLPVPRRKPLDYRKVLTGIIFVLKTGIPWEELPQEMGCGCGMTCLNYLNAWQRAGVWEKLHQILLAELEQADKLDWSRAAVDSAKARALGGGDQTGPNPTDRGKPGTKHHVLTEGQGVPLVTHSTGANVPDVNELLPLVDDIPPVRRKADRPRGVPDNLYADRAYDSQPHRQELEARGIDPHLARRRTEHGSGLGVYRWVAERTLSWLHSFRRLRLRTDREGPVHDAFVSLASALICMWFL